MNIIEKHKSLFNSGQSNDSHLILIRGKGTIIRRYLYKADSNSKIEISKNPLLEKSLTRILQALKW